MRGLLFLSIVSLLTTSSASNTDILMSAVGSNSFTVALIGMLGAILLRDNGKK